MIDPLARLALTGTARQPNAAIRTQLPVDSLIEPLAAESPERRLLLAAGAAAVYRSAGQPLLSAPAVASAAPAETRPPCSPKVAHVLVDLVGAKQADLVLETTQLLDQAGQRVPHDILPVLLDATDARLRTALRPVLGERGRWLAPFNPAWLWAVKTDELPVSLSDLETIWNEGNLAARVAVLAHLHEAQPQRARDWLSQVWPKEKKEPRAELLAAFGASLTSEDEPFIENILDDRSMTVRRQAARLLARIPGSRLSQRMMARADAMLAYERPKPGIQSKLTAFAGAGTGTLNVEPPQEIDAGWERDGIPATPPESIGIGKRAHWLRSVLAMVPWPHWQQRFGAAPEILLSAARGTEWWEPIVLGWTEAAYRFADAGWLSILWSTWLALIGDERESNMQRKALLIGLPAMVAAMPHGDAEGCLLAALKSSLPVGTPILDESLRALSKPWSAEFAGQYLVRLRQNAAAAPSVQRSAAVATLNASALLAVAAQAIPPACFAQALAPWPQIPGEDHVDKAWQHAIARFIETVQLRKTLIEEIAS